MSMVAHLHDDDSCWCPACGESIEDVSIDSESEQDLDGSPEYLVYCPYCGQGFYAHKDY